MHMVILLVALILFLVVPALVAVVLLTGLFAGLEMLALGEWLTMLLSALIGAGVFAFALGTSLLRGFLISVIVVVMQAALLYLLLGVWLGETGL